MDEQIERVSRVTGSLLPTWEERLIELIATDSRSGREARAQARITTWLEELGFATTQVIATDAALEQIPGLALHGDHNDRPSVVGVMGNAHPGAPHVLLNGHVDTVEPANEWTIDPWMPHRDGDAIVGLGSVDMKAGLVGMLAAVAVARELAPEVRGRLQVQSVVDEEAGGGVGTAACLPHAAGADFAIVGEPTELTVCTHGMGSLVGHLEVHGSGAHANIKGVGLSAIDEGLRLATALVELDQAWSHRPHPTLPPARVNIGRIEAGSGATAVATTFRMEFCVGYHPDSDIDVRAELQRAIREVVDSPAWQAPGDVCIDVIHDVEPLPVGGPNTLRDRFVDAINRASGSAQGGTGGFPAGSDARLLKLYGGIPTVLFGPGSITRAHVAGEYVLAREFRTYIERMAYALLGLDQVVKRHATEDLPH